MEKLENLKLFRALATEYRYPSEEQLLRELKTIKSQVLYLLEKFPQSTNGDFYSSWLWLRTFPRLNLPWLEWEKICNLSGKLQTISRVRRIIQNKEKRFLSTDPKIRAKRQRRSQLMKKAIRRA